MCGDLKNICDENQYKEFDTFRKEQHGNSLHYRFMETMRNYVQHRALLIHSQSFDRTFIHINPDIKVITITPIVKKTEIIEDDEVNRKLKNDLDKLPEDIDLKPYIRTYLTGISKINMKCREILKNDLVKWREILEQYIDKGFKHCHLDKSNKNIFVHCFKIDKSTFCPKEIDKIDLFLDFDDYRKNLTSKNLKEIEFECFSVSNAEAQVLQDASRKILNKENATELINSLKPLLNK